MEFHRRAETITGIPKHYFKYDTSDAMGKLFDLEADGYFYTRLQNPTNDAVAAKICALRAVWPQCLHHLVRQKFL